MTTVDLTPPPSRFGLVLLRDGLVPMAMTVVAFAIGVGGHLQLGLTFETAALAAGLSYAAFVSGHVLIWRAQRPARDRRHVQRRPSAAGRAYLEPELGGIDEGTALTPAPLRPEEIARRREASREFALELGAAVRAAAEAARATSAPTIKTTASQPARGDRQPRRDAAEAAARIETSRPAPPEEPKAASPRPPRHAPTREEAQRAAVKPRPMRPDLVRPVAPPPVPAGPSRWTPRTLAEDEKARAPEPLPMAVEPAAADAAGDVDTIQDIIKRLAADIATGRSELVRAEGAPAAPTPAQLASDDLAASVEALNVAAAAMRRATAPAAQPAPGSMQQDSPEAQLAAMSKALATESLDVFLEPILGLTDQRAQHYEVTVRLSAPGYGALDMERLGLVARGTGLLPLLDALKVSRTAAIASQMSARGRTGSLLSNVAGESLDSARFIESFSGASRQGEGVTGRLVLSFAQGDVRGFAPAHWSTLADMATVGFRFALEAVTDLEMDFERLRTIGFTFVKLDARNFIEGLPVGDGIIPPADVCRYFARLGLGLIVGRIDDADQYARIVGFGAVLGQGALFGAPRPVKADILAAGGRAA